MPVLGNRGTVAPREVAAAKAGGTSPPLSRGGPPLAPSRGPGPVFAGPLDSHPFFAAQHEAQQRVAQLERGLPSAPTKGQRETTRKISQSNREGFARLRASLVPAEEKRRAELGIGKPANPLAIGKSPAAHFITPKEKAHNEAIFHEAMIGANIMAPGQFLSGLATAAENAPSNALNTIRGIIPSTVATVGAGVEALKGNPKKLLEIGKQTAHVFLHPWTSFQKEPVATGLMLAAPEQALGRGAGFLARAGDAAGAATMDRAPLVIYGKATGASGDQITAGLHDIAVPRRYSPNVIHKGIQKAVEGYQRQVRGRDPNMATGEQANRYLYGGGILGQHVMKRLQGTFKPGLVDKQAASGELLRRAYTKAAASYLAQIKPKVGADAVPLAVEGVIRNEKTVVPDLTKELERLKSVTTNSNKEKRLNKANQKQIEGLLADKKFLAEPHHAFEAARQYTSWSRPIEEQLVRLGHLEPDQLHARNMPYAMAHMGAKYNLEPGPHPLVGELAAAQKELKNARQGVSDAVARRKAAEIAHPSAGVTTRVATARRALRGAELAKATAEGRKDRAGITGHQSAVREARAEYKYAKQEHVEGLSRQADAAYVRHLEADKRVQEVQRQLHDLKSAGAIKVSGDMYRRLEVNGKPLSHAEIEAHMAKHLQDRQVGFLTHKIEQTYGKNLQSFVGKRPGTETHMRTGASFEKGVYKRDFGALRLQAYRNANLLAGHESRDAMLRRFGLGRFHTKEEAERAADRYVTTPEGQRLASLGNLTVQHIGPDRIVAAKNVQTRAFGPIINDFLGPTDRAIQETVDAPKYTLIHDRVAQRIGEHDALNHAGNLAKPLQWYTNKWRSAALYTSPRWLLGNPQEHAIRLAFASVNPAAIFGAGRAVRLGKDILGEWHSIAADTSRSETERYVAQVHIAAYEAGTHYGSLATNEVRREAKDVMDQGAGRDLAEAFDETAGPHQMIEGWNKWKGAVGQGMSAIERNTKAAGLGKAAINETRKFSGEWMHLVGRQDAAIKAFAENKLAPNESVQLGDDIMSMMGNWNTLTPTVRKAVQTVTPFGLWWLNSMKFVFRTLPSDHPFKSAALAAMASATGQSRNESALPEYLQGGISITLPIVGKVTLTPGYYSPMGVAIEPSTTATGMIAPQFSDTIKTALGVNPATNKEIRGASQEQLIAQGLYSGAIGAIPGARQAGQLIEQGGKHEYNSFNPFAVKPGTQRGLPTELVKILSPLRLTLGAREAKPSKGTLREPALKEKPLKEKAIREKPLKEKPLRE